GADHFSLLFHPFQESPMSMRSWTRNLFSAPPPRTCRKQKSRRRLALERLEDRTVPSFVAGSFPIGNDVVVTAFPSETNNVKFTPTLFLAVDDTNPLVALPPAVPTRFLEGIELDLGADIFGVHVTFPVPILPFDLPGQALVPNFSAFIGSTIAGFGGG